MISALRAFNALQIAAALVSDDGRILSANEALSDIFGDTPASLEGADLHDLLRSRATKLIGEGAATSYCLVVDGSPKWLRLDRRQIDNRAVVVLTDVTVERTQIEEQRNFYSVRDRLLLDGQVGTWGYDPDADLYRFSSELALGHEQATAPVPTQVLQLIQHAADRDKDTAIRERITREGGVANAEMRYRAADGSWTHLAVHYRSGRKLPSGRYEMFGISQDITAVAKARDEAAQFSQRLALALKAAEAGVFQYDFKAKSFWASQELTEMIGADTVEMLRQEPAALFIAADRALAREFFVKAAQGTARSIDLRMIGVRGTRWVRFYFDVKKKSADGAPLRGVGLLIDIDERKRQEIELAEARRAADYANRTKTEFLANMSHELRTPMNAILGFAGLIEQQAFGPISERYLEYVGHIRGSGEHLLDLINDVLDLSKLEAGKLELRESEVDVVSIIDDCLTLLRERAHTGRVRLDTVRPPADLPLLRADARAVKQLLLNLLSNAIKFTPEGGKVTVRAWRQEDGDVFLAVADTGIGMAPGDVEKALSPFGQIDSALARKHEGTGLGLPICRSLMELHGGELTVESELGKGTTMTARFPSARAIDTMRTSQALSA
ncbi:MAG: PAS domain-containing protein [Alphaproteobacteria bacterium]|nr:PAS domain-containing protein [Alphaproteobacteria bacterium]